MGKEIKIAICGVGNCASSLIQGISKFSHEGTLEGLTRVEIAQYKPSDIKVVAAFDVDKRKVGKDISKAIFAEPNNTLIFEKNIRDMGVVVKKGPTLDGIAAHTQSFPENRRIQESLEPEENVSVILKETRPDFLINYLPVGSQQATEYYANACLDAGVHFINAIPTFIASNDGWRRRFKEKNLYLIGDDIKSQVGATIVHRTLCRLLNNRGVSIKKTYQLNVGGNTDFLNMMDGLRIVNKKISKTESVRSQISNKISNDNIHIGPSDYVPWLNDNKIAFIRIEGELFGGVPIEIELRLSVEDSPNSAGVMVDVIRSAKVALENGEDKMFDIVSAYGFKSPFKQMPDEESWKFFSNSFN